MRKCHWLARSFWYLCILLSLIKESLLWFKTFVLLTRCNTSSVSNTYETCYHTHNCFICLKSLSYELHSVQQRIRHCTFEELHVILHSKPFIILTPSVVQSSSSSPFLRLFLEEKKRHLISFLHYGIVLCKCSLLTGLDRFEDSLSP